MTFVSEKVTQNVRINDIEPVGGIAKQVVCRRFTLFVWLAVPF